MYNGLNLSLIICVDKRHRIIINKVSKLNNLRDFFYAKIFKK